MSLQTYCRKPVVRISPETNITEACQLLEQNNIGCLVAEREGKLCGIWTDRDIALRVTGAKRDPDLTKVKEIMTLDDLIAQLGEEMSEIGKAIAEKVRQGNA